MHVLFSIITNKFIKEINNNYIAFLLISLEKIHYCSLHIATLNHIILIYYSSK